ncbi:hypothetical protein OAN96_01395 [Candidatus Gracilibacteria bacterium]|nr:hypothetical protein [Candidatus Gracilibacteria bacterium]
MRQSVFILGASGNVGRELIKQIVQKDGIGKHSNPSVIVGVANSNSYIFDSRGISGDILSKILDSRVGATDMFTRQGTRFQQLGELLDQVKQNGLNGEVVFADVTAGQQELLDFHKQVLLDSHNYLVTANKNPISLFSMQDFKDLTAYGRKYDTNTAVMGGAGILNFVNERHNGIGDDIFKIEGVFSGTLGYILSELEKQKNSFSDIVIDAHAQGYTEPNPWDDLNGLDVARKLIILARYAGHNVELGDVQVTPLIDQKYADYSGDDFFRQLEQLNDSFAKQVESARGAGNVLRYVAEMDASGQDITLTVGLKIVSKDSDLGSLSGTSNLALIETDILAVPLPHVIKSRGAGLAVTAGAVRVGISKMLPRDIKTQ